MSKQYGYMSVFSLGQNVERQEQALIKQGVKSIDRLGRNCVEIQTEW